MPHVLGKQGVGDPPIGTNRDKEGRLWLLGIGFIRKQWSVQLSPWDDQQSGPPGPIGRKTHEHGHVARLNLDAEVLCSYVGKEASRFQAQFGFVNVKTT